MGAGLGLQPVRRLVPGRAKAALGIVILLLVLASLPPVSGSPVPLTIVLALAAGIPMTVFTAVGEWSHSTTVMPSNIIKWINGVVGAAAGQESEARRAVFGGILLSFAAGVIATALAMPYLGAGTIRLAACLVLIALGRLIISNDDTDKQ